MSTAASGTFPSTSSSEPRKRSWKRIFALISGVILVVYCVFLALFDYAMHQPPQDFSRVMMHVGPAPFLLFPFETMWKSARAGSLSVGDTAPDFTLPALDHSQQVTLSQFRGKQPVVLVFGSYT